MTDSVNHPSHYNQYEGLEIWDLVELMNFNLGNAIKYITRAGHKDPSKEAEDINKAIAYIRREQERVFKTEADHKNYGEIVDVLSSQLSHFRAFAVRYICQGSNEYLAIAIDCLEEELKLLQLPPDKKMHRENLIDPKIHARNETVRQWVSRAIRLGKDPDYDPEFLANNTSHNIIRLFY